MLLTVVVPVAAPILTLVAAPPMFSVVVVTFNKLNVDCVDVRSPPLTTTSPVVVILPVTVTFPITVPPVVLFKYLFSTYETTAACVGTVSDSVMPVLAIKFVLLLTSLNSTPTGMPSLWNGPIALIPDKLSWLALSVIAPVNALTLKNCPTAKLPI